MIIVGGFSVIASMRASNESGEFSKIHGQIEHIEAIKPLFPFERVVELPGLEGPVEDVQVSEEFLGRVIFSFLTVGKPSSAVFDSRRLLVAFATLGASHINQSLRKRSRQLLTTTKYIALELSDRRQLFPLV